MREEPLQYGTFGARADGGRTAADKILHYHTFQHFCRIQHVTKEQSKEGKNALATRRDFFGFYELGGRISGSSGS